jgi:hypothetical protein
MGQGQSSSVNQNPIHDWVSFITKRGSGKCYDVFGGGGDVLGIDTDGSSGLNVPSNIIREIANAFGNMLKTGLPKSDMSNADLVVWIRDTLPNPDDQKTITANESSQRMLCDSLCKLLKKIDPSTELDMSNDNVCPKIADTIDNIINGMQSEFNNKTTAINRMMTNINTIGTKLNKEKESIDNNPELKKTKEFYDSAIVEYGKQKDVLSQLITNIISPTDDIITKLVNDNKKNKSNINTSTAKIGSAEFGDQLGYTLAGVTIVADVIHQITSASDKLVSGVKGMVESSSMLALEKDVSSAKNKASGKDVALMANIAKTVEELKTTYKSEVTAYEATGGSEHAGLVSGGLPTIETRLKKQAGDRITLLKSFTNKAHSLFEQMLSAVFNMSKKLGTQIPLSDDLARFVYNLDQMGTVYTEGIEYALTGYYTHASATEQRERFIGQLQSVLAAINPLMSGQGSEHFATIKTPLEELQKHVDFYVDKFNINSSSTIQSRYMPEPKVGAGEGTLEDRVRNAAGEQGNDKESAVGGGTMSQAGLTLKNVTRTLKHFYAVAKMRANLSKVASESKEYNKEYSAVLGESMSKCIDACKKDFNEFKEQLEGKDSSKEDTLYNGYMKLGKVYNSIKKSVNSSEQMREWDMNNILKVKKSMVDAKIELYRALQAIDGYLMQFSDGVAATPDDIKEVSKMLDSIKIVSEWFNDRSGDSVAALFEYMPMVMRRFEAIDSPLFKANGSNTAGAIVDERTGQIKGMDNGHYLDNVNRVSTRPGAAPNDWEGGAAGAKFKADHDQGQPGNPFIVISPQRALYAQSFAKKTVHRILALKNIVSAFTYLGQKFSNDTEKVFMSPGQLYNALVNYLHVSAFTMGWDGYKDDTGNEEQDHAFSKTLNSSATGASAGIHAGANGAAMSIGNVNASVAGGVASFSSTIIDPGYSTTAETAALIAAGTAANDAAIDAALAPLPMPFRAAAAAAIRGAAAGNARVAAAAALRRQPFSCWAADVDANSFTDGGMGVHLGTTGGRNWTTAINGDLRLAAGKNRWPFIAYECEETTMKDAPIFVKCAFGCGMNSVPNSAVSKTADGYSNVGGWHGEFNETDKLFSLGIKAMVAKVFTVSGLYNMFNYKSRDDHTMSSSRFVIGGAAGGVDTPASSMMPSSVPEIHEGAIELYIRLPLLVEFYRDVFSLDNASPTEDNLVITLVPEMDPLWTNIMRLAFNSHIGSGGVITKNYAALMVKEINSIYIQYKDKPNIVSSVINDFIADVNSRFGIMKSQEIRQYKEGESARRTASTGNQDDDVRDFDILDDSNHGDGSAPSDKFGKESYKAGLGGNVFKMSFISAIADFRNKIDNKVRNAVFKNESQQQLGHRIHGIPNFHDQTRMVKDSMKASTSPEQRFNQIFATISGLDSATKRAGEAYTMFHETVVAPLAVLASIQASLKQFELTVWKNCIGTAFTLLDKELGPGVSAFKTATWLVGDANFGSFDVDFTKLLKTKLPSHITDDMRVHVVRPNMSVTLHTSTNLAKDNWKLFASHISPTPPVASVTESAAYISEWTKTSHQTITSVALWYEKCFKQLTQLIIAHTGNMGGMVDINVSGKKLIVDHSKLQQYCEDTLAFVRKSVHKFRGVVDSTVLEKYENTGTNGSIGNLQHELIDNMFKGANSGGLPSATMELTKSFMVFGNTHPETGRPAFTRNATIVSNVAGTPMIVPNGAGAVNAGAGLGTVDAANGTGTTDANFKGPSLDDVMSELVYYNPKVFTKNIEHGCNLSTVENAAGARLISAQGQSFMSIGNVAAGFTSDDPLTALLQSPSTGTGGGRVFEYPDFAARWKIYTSNEGGFRGDRTARQNDGFNAPAPYSDSQEGLMMRFNEVLHQYLVQFWDKSSTKMYQPVIAEFANGVANQATTHARGWPDMILPGIGIATADNIINTVINPGLAVPVAPFDGATLTDLRRDGTPNNILLQQMAGLIDFQRLNSPDNWDNPPAAGANAGAVLAAPFTRHFHDVSWTTNVAAIAKSYTLPLNSTIGLIGSMINKIGNSNVVNAIMVDTTRVVFDGLGLVAYKIDQMADDGRAAAAPRPPVDGGHQLSTCNVGDHLSGGGVYGNNTLEITLFQEAPGADAGARAIRAAAETNGTFDLNSSLLALWTVKACIRVRNNIVNAMKGSLITPKNIIATIISVTDDSMIAEHEWHVNRITTFLHWRRGNAQFDDQVGGNNATMDDLCNTVTVTNSMNNIAAGDGRTAWDAGNTDLIKANTNKIMAYIKKYVAQYRDLVASCISTKPSPVTAVFAAMYALPLIGSDLEKLFTPAAGGVLSSVFSGDAAAVYTRGANDVEHSIQFVQGLLFLGLTLWQIKLITDDSPKGKRCARLLITGSQADTIAGGNNLNAIDVSGVFGLGVASHAGAWQDVNTMAMARAGGALVSDSRIIRSSPGANTELLVSTAGAGAGASQIAAGLGFATFAEVAAGGGGRAAAILAAMNTAVGAAHDVFIAATVNEIGPVNSSIPTDPNNEPAWGNPEEIVFASIGKMMKTILTEQSRTNQPAFLITNMSDVPLRMKESFKANMPIFIKMFGGIRASADSMKKILRINPSLTRNLQNHARGYGTRAHKADVHGRVRGMGQNEEGIDMVSSDQYHKYYSQLLDRITSACEGIIKCSTTVLDELADNPMYLETHENSIADFRNSTNLTPFMPPSSMLVGLQSLAGGGDNITRSHDMYMPTASPASREFELCYGTRLVLGRPTVQALLDHYPGMREITENYNKTSVTEKQIALEDVGTYLGKYTSLLRWSIDQRILGPLTNGLRTACETKLFADDNADKVAAIGHDIRPLAATMSIDRAISLTINSDKNGSIVSMHTHIGGRDDAKDRPMSREDVQIYNIIDMNVNPININALRREVPLVNLLNYAYTFDSFACDIIGKFEVKKEDEEYTGSADAANSNGLQALLSLTLHPYMPVDFGKQTAGGRAGDSTHEDILNAFMSGVGINTIMDGHDRFAVDQVFGKALFANVVGGIRPDQSGRHAMSSRSSTQAANDAAKQLKYIEQGSDDGRKYKDGQVTTSNLTYLRALGGIRFDTTFIRNLLLISTAHRLMRAKMAEELTKNAYPVATGPAVVSRKVTDALPWETWEELRTD